MNVIETILVRDSTQSILRLTWIVPFGIDIEYVVDEYMSMYPGWMIGNMSISTT